MIWIQDHEVRPTTEATSAYAGSITCCLQVIAGGTAPQGSVMAQRSASASSHLPGEMVMGQALVSCVNSPVISVESAHRHRWSCHILPLVDHHLCHGSSFCHSKHILAQPLCCNLCRDFSLNFRNHQMVRPPHISLGYLWADFSRRKAYQEGCTI